MENVSKNVFFNSEETFHHWNEGFRTCKKTPSELRHAMEKPHHVHAKPPLIFRPNFDTLLYTLIISGILNMGTQKKIASFQE